jgi:hypothetical protein
MTVRALLWTYKPRKDGKCNIKIYIHKGGKKKYRSTEYFAREEDWDKDSHRLKRSARWPARSMPTSLAWRKRPVVNLLASIIPCCS